jgi:hypothetical protein
LNDQIENKLKFYKKIKRIRIKFNISKNQRTILKFYLAKQDFQGDEREKREKEKKSLVPCYNSNTAIHRHKKKGCCGVFNYIAKVGVLLLGGATCTIEKHLRFLYKNARASYFCLLILFYIY